MCWHDKQLALMLLLSLRFPAYSPTLAFHTKEFTPTHAQASKVFSHMLSLPCSSRWLTTSTHVQLMLPLNRRRLVISLPLCCRCCCTCTQLSRSLLQLMLPLELLIANILGFCCQSRSFALRRLPVKEVKKEGAARAWKFCAQILISAFVESPCCSVTWKDFRSTSVTKSICKF